MMKRALLATSSVGPHAGVVEHGLDDVPLHALAS
jgi:hypothetical protein